MVLQSHQFGSKLMSEEFCVCESVDFICMHDRWFPYRILVISYARLSSTLQLPSVPVCVCREHFVSPHTLTHTTTLTESANSRGEVGGSGREL